MLFCIDTKTQEIHTIKCDYFPETEVKFLGKYDNINRAIQEAINLGFHNPKTCFYCC